MAEYTPTTDEVRDAYSITVIDGSALPERAAEFDRWLAAHDREVAAKALRDAAAEGHVTDGYDPDGFAVEVALGGADYVTQWLHDRADRIERDA